MGNDPNVDKNNHVEQQSPKPIVEKPEIHEIPIEQIEVGEFCQRRETDETLASLAENIQQHGLIHFPTVMEEEREHYLLISGHRRYFACQDLGLKTLACHVVRVTKEEAAFLSLSENIARHNPDPVKQAEELCRLKKLTGLSDAQIAEKVGLTQSGVSERLSILLLGEDILQDIDLTHAIELARITRMNRFNGQLEVRRLRNKAINHGVSAREIRSLATLMETGEYDRLPDKLKDLLMEDKYMTADMARLCLDPEGAVEGEGKMAERLKAVVRGLGYKEMEKFVLQAVKRRLTVGEAKEQLAKMLERLLQEEEDHGEGPFNAQKVLNQVSGWIDDTEHWRARVSVLVESGPKELAKLSKAWEHLVWTWQAFTDDLKEAAADQMVTSAAPGSTLEGE